MSAKISQKEAIDRCIEVHGDEYDYSKMIYKGRHEKIQIKCKSHGWFWQHYGSHVRGIACPLCGQLKRNENIRSNLNDLINKANIIHDFKYKYHHIKTYKSLHSKVPIECTIHGIFFQCFHEHLKGNGCPKCSHLIIAQKLKKTLKEILRGFIKKHKTKYNYELIQEDMCKKNTSKIPIICPIHGMFYQQIANHLRGQGCPRCGGSFPLNTEEFIKRAKRIHNNKYDYSKSIYINNNKKVIIICQKHGEFFQSPSSHLRVGCGCPQCKQSKGEKLIYKILENNNVRFITQKTFINCKNKIKLRFDFYIPDKNILIEFDGWQHFYDHDYFGGLNGFISIQSSDEIKNKYCEDNNIPLIRIPYWLLDDPKEIEEILINDIR